MIFCCARLRAVGPRPTARSAFSAVCTSELDATSATLPEASVAAAVVDVVIVVAACFDVLLLLKRIGWRAALMAFFAVGRVIASMLIMVAAVALSLTRCPKARAACRTAIWTRSLAAWVTGTTQCYLKEGGRTYQKRHCVCVVTYRYINICFLLDRIVPVLVYSKASSILAFLIAILRHNC